MDYKLFSVLPARVQIDSLTNNKVYSWKSKAMPHESIKNPIFFIN